MKRNLVGIVVPAMLSMFSSGVATAAVHGTVGVMCQKEYQNGWQTTLNYAWDNCAGFKNAIGGVAYYYNLHGAETLWEDSNDYYYLDAVDLFYTETHGGAWTGRAVWAMWDQGSLASSSEMVLGNENRQLSILSTYSCETLKHDDIVGRWRSIMRGGLRYVTGSHDKFYDGWTTDEVGEDYADNLNDGDTIRYAWRDGVSDWWTDQDATVMTTGTDATDCSNRRAGMRWTNFNSYPRRTGSQVVNYCWTYWNDL